MPICVVCGRRTARVYWAHRTMRVDLRSVWQWRLGLDRLPVLDFAIHLDYLGNPVLCGFEQIGWSTLWQLIRHPERTRSWMALLALQTEEANGLRPHEWNPRLLEQILTIDASANEYVYCQLMGFYRQLDEDREAGALEHLENALARSARVGRALRHGLFLEAASASAILRKQADQARSWRERACKLRKPESLDV